MTQYAVGDIQGCYTELMDCLNQVNFNPDQDCLWVAGDMVNRGPDSLATLAFLYENRNSLRCVLGNHDLHLLAIYFGHRQAKSSDTVDQILSHPDCDHWMEWLRQQPLCQYDSHNQYFMSHAGLPPQWSIKQALSYSEEIASVLNSEAIDAFLATMYGNTPSHWQTDLSGTDRLRCITNYFTRMRICDIKGGLEFDYKGSLADIPAGYYAWFKHPHRQSINDRIIFGHWASLGGYTDNNTLFGLDTACVWGQHLTLMQLDNQQYFTASPAPRLSQ